MRGLLKILPILLMTLTVITHCVTAQEAQFSQFYSASLFLNPAFAGASDNTTISANARLQPTTSDVTNELQQVSIETPIYLGSASENKLAGVGITLFNQTTGRGRALKTMGGMLAISKPISFDVFGPQSVIIGVQGGMVRRSLDFSQLTWGSQWAPFAGDAGFDPTIPVDVSQFEDNKTVAVINAGIMYQYNPEKDYLLYSISFFSGIAATNINQPNISFNPDDPSKQPLQLKYHGGFEYVLNGRYHLSPNVLLAYTNGNIQTNIGSYLSIDFKSDQIQSFEDNIRLVGGIWYRLRDSFIFLVGISKQKYRLGFSYDLNKGFLGDKNRLNTLQPAFELSLNYTLKSRSGSGRFSNPLF